MDKIWCGVKPMHMAAKPLTTEAIALTEKKVDMSLDDIIKMSKKNSSKGRRPPRVSNKSQGFQKVVALQRNSSKVQRFMESRSSVRQGVLARRRTNFQANQFPITTEVARKAVVAPIRNRRVNWNKPRVAAPAVQRHVEGTSNGKESTVKPRPQTLDARFASMKQQRMRVMNQQMVRGGVRVNPQSRRGQQQQQQRGRGVRPPVGAVRRMGNF